MQAVLYNFDLSNCRPRWVCFLDILGFKQLLMLQGISLTVNKYFESREIVEWCLRKKVRLRLVCFSDSFVIYSEDDSVASFAQLEQAARWTLNLNIAKEIPLRGAISHGEMYACEQEKIYVGIALNEAYEHGENQNWIGLLLCRSATKQLSCLKLPASRRLNYRRWPVPWSERKPGQKPHYVYQLGGANWKDYLNNFRRMELTAGKARGKYRRTIEFLESCSRPAAPPRRKTSRNVFKTRS